MDRDVPPLFIGKIVRFSSEVNSTNIWASDSVKMGSISQGTAFRADFQTHGKGQRNRKWLSVAGQNLLVSYVLYPFFLRVDRQFGLIQVVALALADVLAIYGIENTRIKWPNDIYVNDLKIAGVLIESIIRGGVFSSAVVGIGLNVNQIDFETDLNATSILRELKVKIDLVHVFNQLSVCLEKRYLMLKSQPIEIDQLYKKCLYKYNLPWMYQIEGVNNTPCQMCNRGVNEIGQLLLENNKGIIQPYALHQVKMMI